jgi:hypothetical protein
MTNEFNHGELIRTIYEALKVSNQSPIDEDWMKAVQELANAIRAEIRHEMTLTPDAFVASMGEPQAAPPAFAVGTRVRVLVDDALVKEGDEGEIKGKSYVGGKIVWDVKVDGLAGMCEFEPHELEPLSEPAPMGAPALPEGVTRVQRDTPRGAAFVVERQGVDAVNLVYFDGSKTIDVKCGADRILFDLDDFENFIAAGQALIAEKRANNGR